MEQLEFLRYLDFKFENELLSVMKLPYGVPDGLVDFGCCVMVTHNVNNELSNSRWVVKCELDLC